MLPIGLREWKLTNMVVFVFSSFFQTGDKRLARLRTLCHNNSVSLEYSKLTRILVDDNYRFLFCSVPKIACTNWKWVMLRLRGRTKSELKGRVHTYNLPNLSDSPPREVQRRLRNFFKFVFVRDPLKRLVSAYRNKFLRKNPYFHKRYGRRIAKRYRNTDSNIKHNGSDITFTEFLQYVGDSNLEDMNPHWMPISELCQLCQMKYDFIGSFEKLREDSERVLRLVNVSRNINFPQKQRRWYKPYNPYELIDRVPSDILQKALDKYSTDYKLLSYKPYHKQSKKVIKH